jgi:S1-C subfamily serine protease
MIDALLLAATRVLTFREQRLLTNASGFFFERAGRLFLVTSRHVVRDEPSNHRPDRLVIEIHVDAGDMAKSTEVSLPLYRDDGAAAWREGVDGGGRVDVAAVEIQPGAIPASATYRAFTPDHVYAADAPIAVGTALLVVGFPLGFHDTLHHLPVARHAVVASSFGLRFQGLGCFLTDARTHRGTSGAPVVMLAPARNTGSDLRWTLLGVHSAVFDVGTRDIDIDEALSLNCAWYADILLALTEG